MGTQGKRIHDTLVVHVDAGDATETKALFAAMRREDSRLLKLIRNEPAVRKAMQLTDRFKIAFEPIGIVGDRAPNEIDLDDARIHSTLVIHGPVDAGDGTHRMVGTTDLENLMILALIRHEAVARKILRLTDDFSVMYISTGSDYECAPNELSIDVAGGRFDQHALEENRMGTKFSSLDLVLKAIDEQCYFGFVLPALNAISQNDSFGRGIVDETPEMKKKRLASATPHTKSDLRTLVKGWNALFKHEPKRIERLAELAFKGIFALLEAKFTDELTALEAEGEKQGWSREELDRRIEVIERDEMPRRRDNEVFMLESIVKGLTMYLDEKGEYGEELTAAQKEGVLRFFTSRCDQALKAWEQEWVAAEQDFRKDANFSLKVVESPSYLRRVLLSGKTEPEIVSRHGTVIILAGQSESDRFPDVVRARFQEFLVDPVPGESVDDRLKRGQEAYKKLRFAPYVFTHFRESDGKFMVTTGFNGVVLDHVASAIRIEDLKLRGARVEKENVGRLASTGGIAVEERGRRFIPFFFPDFRMAFGNAFITNPFMVKTNLTPQTIYRLVKNVILNGVVFPDPDLPCKKEGGSCESSCRYYWYDHAGCVDYRLNRNRVQLRVVK